LHLQLSERLLRLSDTGIRLIDSKGVVWLEGQPDAAGELSGNWQHPGSPLGELLECRLHIQPY
jgi:hypothetical protein